MPECVPLTRRMLKNPIELRVHGPLDFSQAQNLARRRALEAGGEPMLLAWFDRARGALLSQHHLLPGGQTLLAHLRRIPGRRYYHHHQ